MPHQLPWSTHYPNPQPPLSIPPDGRASVPVGHPYSIAPIISPPLSSSPYSSSQQYPLATVALHPDGRNDATAQPRSRRKQPEELRLPPPPPHLQLPSNYPGQAARLSNRPVAISPSKPLCFTGPSPSSLSTTSKAIISISSPSPSTPSHPVFNFEVFKDSTPNMTLTRHDTSSIVATACWSNSSGSNTLRIWPDTGREVEATLIIDPGSIPRTTRIENVPFGWEVEGGLTWQADLGATDHVLGDHTGTVLARWNTTENRHPQQDDIGGYSSNGISGSGTDSRYVRSHIPHARFGLQSPASSSISGLEGGNEISRGGKALRSAGEPLLTILAAPPGTDVSNGMWVEFVVASGVCVLARGR